MRTKIIHNLISISFFITTAFLGGCSVSSLSKQHQNWQDSNAIIKSATQLQVGDILISAKDWSEPLSWWGHSAIIVDDRLTVGEYPKLGYGYLQYPLSWWLIDRDKVQVLRYKNSSPAFKNRLVYNLKQLEKFDYGLLSSKANLSQNEEDIDLYCSSYIWYVYQKTAKDLGFELDIDFDGGGWVMPYDILQSKQLEDILYQ